MSSADPMRTIVDFSLWNIFGWNIEKIQEEPKNLNSKFHCLKHLHKPSTLWLFFYVDICITRECQGINNSNVTLVSFPGEIDRKEAYSKNYQLLLWKGKLGKSGSTWHGEMSFHSCEWSPWVSRRADEKALELSGSCKQLLVKSPVSTTPPHQNKWWAGTTSTNAPSDKDPQHCSTPSRRRQPFRTPGLSALLQDAIPICSILCTQQMPARYLL